MFFEFRLAGFSLNLLCVCSRRDMFIYVFISWDTGLDTPQSGIRKYFPNTFLTVLHTSLTVILINVTYKSIIADTILHYVK
jgi:hypothetical protein